MQLYYFPLSTYSQKVVIAFREKGLAFEPKTGQLPRRRSGRVQEDLPARDGAAAHRRRRRRSSPSRRSSSSASSALHPNAGTRLIPADPAQAELVRLWDRQIDWYLSESFSKIFFDGRKPENLRDPAGVAAAKERLGVMFQRLDRQLADKTWVVRRRVLDGGLRRGAAARLPPDAGRRSRPSSTSTPTPAASSSGRASRASSPTPSRTSPP